MEVQSSKDDKKGALEVELKPLPTHLRYEFLSSDRTFPIIVTTKLNGNQFKKLLAMLKKHGGVIGYSIDDIKKISPLTYMHMILLDKRYKPSRQTRRHLNLKM